MFGWQPSLSHCYSSRHFIYCSPGEPVSICSTIDSLCYCSAHSSIPKGHSLPWFFLLCSVSSYSLCIFWYWLGRRSHWSQVHHWLLLSSWFFSDFLVKQETNSCGPFQYWSRISCLCWYHIWAPLATMASQRPRCVYILYYSSLLWQPECHSYYLQWCLPWMD